MNALVDQSVFVVILIIEFKVKRKIYKERGTIFLFLRFVFSESLIADLELFSVGVNDSCGERPHFILLNFRIHLMILSKDFLFHFRVEKG